MPTKIETNYSIYDLKDQTGNSSIHFINILFFFLFFIFLLGKKRKEATENFLRIFKRDFSFWTCPKRLFEKKNVQKTLRRRRNLFAIHKTLYFFSPYQPVFLDIFLDMLWKMRFCADNLRETLDAVKK